MSPQNTTSSTQMGTHITSVSTATTSRDAGESVMNRGTMSFSQTTPSIRASEPKSPSSDSIFTSGRNHPTSPNPQAYQYASAQPRSTRTESVYSHGSLTPPNQSPRTQRRTSPNHSRTHERNMSGSFPFAELSPGLKYDQQSAFNMLQVPVKPVVSPNSPTSGRRSPRMDRVPSPGPFKQSQANTLPSSFAPNKTTGRGHEKFLQYGNQMFKVTHLYDHFKEYIA